MSSLRAQGGQFGGSLLKPSKRLLIAGWRCPHTDLDRQLAIPLAPSSDLLAAASRPVESDARPAIRETMQVTFSPAV
jgi:hypothetical protein